MTGPPFITRVRIQGYKSIRWCDVSLGELSILVGPNGSGKSNFLDALGFVSDALSSTLDYAVRERGGSGEILHRATDARDDLAIRLDLRLPDGGTGYYALRAIRSGEDGFAVTHEDCEVVDSDGMPDFFRRSPIGITEEAGLGANDARVEELLASTAPDRLSLVTLSSQMRYRPLYDALTATASYNLNPVAIRDLQQPGTLVLNRDGGNLAKVLQGLKNEHAATFDRVVDYMRRVMPSILAIEPAALGPFLDLAFLLRGGPAEDPQAFLSGNMSDGTLRALGVLVALLQTIRGRPLVVGVEEPETALHPAAVAVLLDAARDATRHAQVLLTSHSPDLLDRDDIDESALLAVTAEHGSTTIGHLDKTGRAALREHMFTAGELLRMNQLDPDVDAGRERIPDWSTLFDQ